ncbi:hypothetical protein HHI36_006199 [Cryptolaemus montrouzieri]|uniref:Uncharacterized protein n=1 Tax=Cryptolaemus montrouzieri TaxID=559131 RepID=A0ABD2NWE4_9CUCU
MCKVNVLSFVVIVNRYIILHIPNHNTFGERCITKEIQILLELGLPSESEQLPKFYGIMASDIITPVVIIGALFVINSIVLFYIYKAKQKNDIKLKDEEIGALNSQEMSAIV